MIMRETNRDVALPTLTIYTPTYNRSGMLSRLYHSLCKQTCKEFIWLIIDDGSTDDTESLVKRWISEEPGFEIEYYYKKNGGVHTARDAAFQLCKTEIIMSEDSDDYLYESAVEIILNTWNGREHKEYAGIIAHEDDPYGKEICPDFPHNVKELTLQEFVFKYKCIGEKYTVLRSDIIKSIPESPSFEGEKVVGENYKWMQLPDIPFIILDKSIGVKDFQKDGLTAISSRYFFNNPRGFREEYKVFINHGNFLRARIKGHLGYIASCIYLREKEKLFDNKRPLGTFLLLPLGVIVYFYLRYRKLLADNKFKGE